MPAILLPRDNSAAAVFSDGSARSHHIQPWLIALVVVLVIGLLIAVALGVFFATRYLRQRQYRRAKEQAPFLTRETFNHRRKMSEPDRVAEAERQRDSMIKKSLASRVSLKRTSQTESTGLSLDDGDDEERAADGLREDWKEWEARVQRERSGSSERHPAKLPVPVKTAPPRPISPTKSPLADLLPTPTPTPTLPSTPTFGPSGPHASSQALEPSPPTGQLAANMP